MTIDRLTEEKIERAKAQLSNSKLDRNEQESLMELLDHSENICNGGGSSLEENSKALGALLRVYVKDRITAADKCFICISQLAGWRGLVIQAKWPLALVVSVALFSPNFPAVLSVAEKFIK